MDYTKRRQEILRRCDADGTALAFVTFVLAHEGCAGEIAETRPDAATLACRCLPCDEARVFRSGETHSVGRPAR